jgi:hypothetical protein
MFFVTLVEILNLLYYLYQCMINGLGGAHLLLEAYHGVVVHIGVYMDLRTSDSFAWEMAEL